MHILSLLRVVEIETKDEEENQLIAVGKVYDATRARSFEPITSQKLLHALAFTPTVQKPEADSLQKKKFKKSKKKDNNLKNFLKTALGSYYGPALIDHIIKTSTIDPLTDDMNAFTQESPQFQLLLAAFQTGDSIITSCINSPQKGYIYEEAQQDANTRELVTYLEFHPFKYEHSREPIVFDSFDKSVDEFFLKSESQKLLLKARQAELHATKKLENVKASHANQIKSFEIAVEVKELYAQAIGHNLSLVDAVIQTVRSFVASGMDWKDLEDLVKDEQSKGNPLAMV